MREGVEFGGQRRIRAAPPNSRLQLTLAGARAAEPQG